MHRNKAAFVFGLLGLTTVTLAFSRAPATPVGPPWMSVELPANPLDPTTRGAALVVHTYHHDQAAIDEMTGTAEGLVDGRRRSIALEFTPTSRANVLAVSKSWPSRGEWVLAIRGSADATLLIQLGPDGGLEDRRYYGQPTHLATVRSVQVLEGAASNRRITRMLRDASDN